MHFLFFVDYPSKPGSAEANRAQQKVLKWGCWTTAGGHCLSMTVRVTEGCRQQPWWWQERRTIPGLTGRQTHEFVIPQPCIKYGAFVLVSDQILPIMYRSLKLYWHTEPFALIWHVHVEFTLHYLARSYMWGISGSMVFSKPNKLFPLNNVVLA